MASPSKRRDSDIMKLMRSGHVVHMADDAAASELFVKMAGPKDSYYEGGFYKIRVVLPTTYPYKSPSIGFCTPILHPNVDEASGSVCLDVINQTWSPMFDLVNVFSVFLPQLLLYPNPSDPLNRQAAQLLMKDPTGYQSRVREHVRQHASKDFHMGGGEEEESDEHDAANEQDEAGEGEDMEEGETDGADGAEDEEDDAVGEEDDEVLSDCDDLPADEPTEMFHMCH